MKQTVTIPFWYIRGVLKNGNIVVYGKQRFDLKNTDNFVWYIKEYGYRSKSGALKGIESLKKYEIEFGFTPAEYTVESINVEFTEEDARKFKLIK